MLLREPFDYTEWHKPLWDVENIKSASNAATANGRIMTVTDQSQVVMNAFFRRGCALLGMLFAMRILYRVISLLLMRNLEKGQAAR